MALLSELSQFFPEDGPAYCHCERCDSPTSLVLPIEAKATDADLVTPPQHRPKDQSMTLAEEIATREWEQDDKVDNPLDCDSCTKYHKGKCPVRAAELGNDNRSVRYASTLHIDTQHLKDLAAKCTARPRKHGAALIGPQIMSTVTSFGSKHFASNLGCLFSIGRPPTWATSTAEVEWGESRELVYDITTGQPPTSSTPIACTEVEVTIRQLLHKVAWAPRSDRMTKWERLPAAPDGSANWWRRTRKLTICPELVHKMIAYATTTTLQKDGEVAMIQGFETTAASKSLLLPEHFLRGQSYAFYWLLAKHGCDRDVPTFPMFRGTTPEKTARYIQLFATPLVQSVTSAMGLIADFLLRVHSVTLK